MLMPHDHPSFDDLSRFLATGGVSSSVQAKIVRHLLAGCGHCRQLLAKCLAPGRALSSAGLNLSPPSREETGSSGRRPARREDPRGGGAPAPETPETAAALEGSIETGDLFGGRFRRTKIASSPPADLVRKSFSLRFRDPARMLELAYRAVREADSREGGDGASSEVAGLRALSWSNLGNCLRIGSHWDLASEAFEAARHYQKLGNLTGDLRARHLQFEAALHGSRGAYLDALSPLQEAARLYSAAGDLRGEVETKLSEATYGVYSGHPEAARRILIPLLSRARGLRAPLLLLSAQHNLVRSYIDLDRPDEAVKHFSGLRALYRQVGDPLILLRATWLEGSLLKKVGHFRNAEAALLRAQRGFELASQLREAGQVGLELEELRAGWDRGAEAHGPSRRPTGPS